MPLYKINCPKCGVIDDVFAHRATAEQEHECPECGTMAPKLPTTFATAGIIFSNALEINSAGVRLESNSEKRKYLEENPTCRFVERESPYWQRKVEKLHESREQKVQKKGYKDWREFQPEKKMETTDSTKGTITLDAGASNAS